MSGVKRSKSDVKSGGDVIDGKKKTYESLLNHIILPRSLPKELPENAINEEKFLISRMHEAVVSCAGWIPERIVRNFQRFKRAHSDLTGKTVSRQIDALEPGDTFAVLVKRQQCVFMVHMPLCEEDAHGIKMVQIGTFPSVASSKEIYKCSGDLQLTCPTFITEVEFSVMLRSEAFSEQLCRLYETTGYTKKNQTSAYVNSWLTGVLSRKKNNRETEFKMPLVTKKIRDEVIGKGEKARAGLMTEPWQRTPFYITMKALLQISLAIENDTIESKFVHKIVMLRFITRFCVEFENPAIFPTLNTELIGQLLTKMARRIEKLDALRVQYGDIKHDEFYNQIVDEAKCSIAKMRARIDRQTVRLQDLMERKSQLKLLRGLNFANDVKQKIPKIQEYLEKRKTFIENENVYAEAVQPREFRRHTMHQRRFPDFELYATLTTELDKEVYLMDCEYWYLYTLELGDNTMTCAQLQKKYNEYMLQAEKIHSGDPREQSLVTLIRLKFVAMMDRMVTQDFPLLLEHRTGIDTNIFGTLLLPQSKDMQIAHELQLYFEQRNEAYYPSLVEESEIVSFAESFAVRYGSYNLEMQEVRQRILDDAEKQIQAKKAEWLKFRQKAQHLHDKAAALRCTQAGNVDAAEIFYHRIGCDKCGTEYQLKEMKITQYQHPLPECIDQQNTIVFELRIPKEIAILRDLLQSINKLGHDARNKVDIKENWIEKELLLPHKTAPATSVLLGSTTTNHPAVFSVEDRIEFKNLVVMNRSNCVLHEKSQELCSSIKIDGIQKLFTLKVEAGSPYAGLQWALISTNHTQNQVLARQAQCPQNLLLSEFKEFGSLRADGHRLQLRKLCAMIETDAMSFDQPSVLSLVLQSMWEMGPRSENSFVRESHEDFINVDFAMAVIELLQKCAEHQEDNWANPTKLLTIVFIALRIFELNDIENDEAHENILNRVMQILHKIRAISLGWLKKIQDVLRGTKEHSQDVEKSLRYSLVVVSITIAATFFINLNHTYFDKSFEINPINGCKSSRIWLMAIITLNNNIKLNSHVKAKAKTNLQMLTRLVRNTGVQIETKMRELIKADPYDLFELIKTQWPEAGRGAFVALRFPEHCLQTVVVDVRFGYEDRAVSIDFITGQFLVNALPVDQLPESIRNDLTHKRVFGDYTFEVQPHGRNRFTTIHEFNGCNYEFGIWNNSTIITERRNDRKESELIPTNIIKGEIPELLIEKYSHWWRKRDDVIVFRPKDFAAENFTKESGIEYILNVNTSQLIEVKTQRSILCPVSNSYQKIQEYFQRLEQPKFIHVLMETPTLAKVELIRLNLKFRIDGTKPNKAGGFDVMSDEFSRMRISLQQNCGTLYGLNHGLLLESLPDNDQTEASKLLILPHSKINLINNGIDIDLSSELRSPPFYRYQVDETLRQLKPCNGNFSAWFYLAYLHAITSHGEAEPLTGMSGTERALQILQSSYVWSSAPYDIEAIKTLILIAYLSPERSLVTQTQKTEWPSHIPSHCAQDSFSFIVHRLIEDSERLHELHFSTDQTQLKKPKNASLNVRDYLRCLPLNPKIRVDDTFIKYKPLETSRMAIAPVSQSRGVRMIAHLYHAKAFYVPMSSSLTSFLIDTANVDGPIHIESVDNYLNHQCRYGMTNMWISCYEVVRKRQMNPEKILLLLSLMAHEGGELDALLALQAIANNPAAFQNINPPNVRTYSNPKGTFDQQAISDILKNSPVNKKDTRTDAMRIAFVNRITNEAYRITEYVKSKWPCEQVNLTTQFTSESIAIAEAEVKIQQRITVWNNNQKLRNFLEKIETVLKQLRSTHVQISGTKIKPEINEVNWPKFEIDVENKMNRRFNDWPALDQAKMVWQMEQESERTVAEWWSIYNTAVLSTANKHLFDAGMFPRMVPSLVLPKLIDAKTNPDLKAIIGALALAIAREQRKNRLAAGGMPGEDNHAYVNWKPCNFPEWLLFEIERDLTIRRIQIEIAKRMINPPDIGTKHSVMQLNMGEGKTAVIVPILASVLANGEQACQIIVLKSLFATNLNSLRQYLGGMLNRRIYIFPCRRDMPITECVTKLLPIYEECKKMKGVILTLPEYLLSFQLKIYESIQKGNTFAAGKFLTVHKWINKHVRNIMDESDAILQAKYQLIYTVGNQLPLDGGINRYAVTQAILKRVPHHMKSLYEKFGDAKIEYDQQYIQNGQVYGAPRVTHRPDVFTPCRILEETVYDELSKLLIDDFVNGVLEIQFPEMSDMAKALMKEFLSEQRNSSVMFDKIKSEFTSVHMDILMILSGLLQFNLLKLVLTRRWRVNYGVNEKGARQMAIPFKAKDVATEMTEFGHPDVAICYTQLSYYYSGLTDEQLIRVFGVLKSNVNAADIYDKWISTVPVELIQPSIELYSGINLDDPTQRDELLFPLLRYNMYVIDYWLSLDVFPREAKTFEKKLSCTAWDLCSDHFEHRVTGFSGTNDTKNILPLPIAQNDLKELERTNENVRQILLRPENQAYQKLPANTTGKMIIQELVNKNIPVLLDSGALMLEFNNEQMAREWLKMAPAVNSDAAVYFDSKDVLQTVDRNGNVVEFDCSVYRDNLRRCLVYVDDVHTRGTDLKFPYGWKACVTLSGDITRDKTVQACMRMRQLGNGHSISFWASHEADTRIRALCNLTMSDKITSEHVINFICTNSERFEMENTVHWAAAAHNYAKKISGHKLFENSIDPTALGNLYDSSVDNELATLETLYGDKKEVKLSEITEWKFNELANTFATQQPVADYIRQIERGVFDKIKDRDQICFRHALDEEQEKELEHEFEEQRHVERPPLSKAAKPTFDKRLHKFFLNGQSNDMRHLKTTGALVPISQGLSNTHLYEPYFRENNAWSSNLFVTQDFVSVLETDSEKCDNFLRPVWWIAGIQIQARIYWILLSSFECDRLLPTFRKSKNATLFMYRPRVSKSHDSLIHDPRLKVTGMMNPLAIDLRVEVEIGVFGGSMFFKSNDEQNVFCNFIGSIPRPRSLELEKLFKGGFIKPNGFVPTVNRKLSSVISQCVGECKFNRNPAGMVIDLIVAHRQIMRKESHVASIVDGGIKVEIDNPDAVVPDIKMEIEDIKEEPDDDVSMDDNQNVSVSRNLRSNSKRKNNEPMVQPTLRRSKRFRSLV